MLRGWLVGQVVAFGSDVRFSKIGGRRHANSTVKDEDSENQRAGLMRLVSRLTSGGQRRLSRCLKAAHANGLSSQQPTPERAG